MMLDWYDIFNDETQLCHDYRARELGRECVLMTDQVPRRKVSFNTNPSLPFHSLLNKCIVGLKTGSTTSSPGMMSLR